MVGLSILQDYDPLFTKTNATTATRETDLNGKPQLYPNPAYNVFYIEGNTLSKAEITDVSGKVVYQTTLRPGRNAISASHFPAGVYVARIYSKEGITSRKIVIAR